MSQVSLCFASFVALVSIVNSFEIKQVSFDQPELCIGETDCVDARDVTVVDDGKCFVYSSEAMYGDPLLSGISDWRIWKTCNIFEDDDIVNILVSPRSDVGYKYTFSSASNGGNRVCYTNNIPDLKTAIGFTDLEIKVIKNVTDAETVRKSAWCDISADGSTIVFESNSNELVEGTQIEKNYQIFITKDKGSSFSMLTPAIIVDEATSKYAQVSGDGSLVSFHGLNIQLEGESTSSSSAYEEWLYRSSDEQLSRITDFYGNECNKTLMFELMEEMWGSENLAAEGLTLDNLGNGQSQCQFFASKGMIPSAGVIDVRDNPSRISDDGRFVTFMASFDASTIRGTYEEESVVTSRNLFLKDTVLGMIWLITKEGPAGPEYDEKLENFCCPYASSSVQRDTCTKSNEYKGRCCWQKPCGHAGVNNDISGDGTSIAYTTDRYPNVPAVNMCWEINHYHIQTGTTTYLTNTTNRDYDDFYPSISAKGNVIGWTSDFNHVTQESIVDNNQIFATKLLMGCSTDDTASNYCKNPDVEVCCEWDDGIGLATCNNEHYEFSLHFEGNANEMMLSVPFTSASTDEQQEFVNQFALQVKTDISCSLGIPKDLVYTSADVSCITDGTMIVTVAFGKSSMYFSSPKTHAEKLIQQYNDPRSSLWRQYLTKTLKDDLDIDYKVVLKKLANCKNQ